MSKHGLDRDEASRLCRLSFEHHARRLDLPTMAWGLTDAGTVVSGEATDAVYRIASMTKSFTAAIVLSLRDAGRLALDDPIERHAPEFVGLRPPIADSPPVTIRHLLTMSSGLATDDAWADRHLDLTDSDLDSIIERGPTFAAVPGTTFEYSNLGFAVLGRVVRNVSGSTLQQLVVESLLEPLGMARTSWTAPPDAMVGFRERSSGADLVAEPMLGDGVMAPMGGLFSCVDDLARWIDFLGSAFDPARHEFDGVLARSTRREMQQVARAFPTVRSATTGTWSQRPGGYGYGLNVLPHPRLGTVVTHSGGLPGFGSNMRWVVGTGVGLVALGNTTYAPMAAMTTAVLDELAESGAVSGPTIDVVPQLHHAAERLVGWVNGTDDGTGLFADNVAADQPRAERVAAMAELVAEHGPVRLARVFAESATSAVAIVHGADAELHVDFQLTPTTPPLVQTYGTTVMP